MGKYLFFDIDGTLISRTRGNIPSAIEALHKAREKGHLCFLSTGRQLNSLKVADAYERDGIVFCNGAGVWYQGEIIALHSIPKEVVEKTIRLADELEGMYSMQSMYRSFKNEREMQRMERSLAEDPRYETFEEMLEAFAAGTLDEYAGQPILKIDMGFASPQILQKFLQRMDSSLRFAAGAGTNVNLGKKSGEITLATVTKSAGIRELLEKIGGSMEDTFGFGDSANDLEMLKECAVGVAMGNASQEVKEIANVVAPDIHEDGIWHIMSDLHLL